MLPECFGCKRQTTGAAFIASYCESSARGSNVMNRLHIVGGKNHGKTTLVVALVEEFVRRGLLVGTIKHTHHHHELDVPGKDSYLHRTAGAHAVGILSPSMTAMFLPARGNSAGSEDRYSVFSATFARCQLVLVEGDSQTTAPKIEVWRNELGTPPLATQDKSILAVVTDDELPFAAEIYSRANVAELSEWIVSRLLNQRLHD
jgi:molybdopterin-guanine dinucleotide biosynthesis protein MobB